VGCALDVTEQRLVVSKGGRIKGGRIKVVLRRPLEGAPKTATIRRTATGKWFVSFSCAWEPTPLTRTHREVGIDVGLTVFAMPTEGGSIANPRFFRSEERALAKAQRKHQVVLDTHKALRAALTDQVKQTHPDLEARRVWQQVSQDEGERTAWRERQRRRRAVARVHERIRWRRGDFAHQESRKLLTLHTGYSPMDSQATHTVTHHVDA
jgi:putative transposase